MLNFEQPQDVKNWLKNIENDKIINILINKSNLTKIQFETFILDLIFRLNKINGFNNKFKFKLRSDKENISRGAFNRIRKQALSNIIKSIFTVFLLGYLGIFDSPQLEPYIEGADKLKSYLENISFSNKESNIEKNLDILTDMIENELIGLSKIKNYYEE